MGVFCTYFIDMYPKDISDFGVEPSRIDHRQREIRLLRDIH